MFLMKSNSEIELQNRKFKEKIKIPFKIMEDLKFFFC